MITLVAPLIQGTTSSDASLSASALGLRLLALSYCAACSNPVWGASWRGHGGAVPDSAAWMPVALELRVCVHALRANHWCLLARASLYFVVFEGCQPMSAWQEARYFELRRMFTINLDDRSVPAAPGSALQLLLQYTASFLRIWRQLLPGAEIGFGYLYFVVISV